MQGVQFNTYQRSFEYDGAKRQQRKEDRKRRDARRGKRDVWTEKE